MKKTSHLDREHGTETGCRQHWGRGEPLCEECQTHFVATRGHRHGREHGTDRGVRQHWGHGESLCDICSAHEERTYRERAEREALNEKVREVTKPSASVGVSVRLPRHLFKLLQEAADREETTPSDVIRRALEDYLLHAIM